jgi:transposase
VKRGKTDAADAEAICEAVTRPTMRFVAVKSVEQQAVLMLHKSRDLMVRQRTMLINALRGHLAEYGIVTGLGAGGVTASLKALHEEQERLPVHAKSALHGIAAQLRALASEIDRLEAQILAWHREDETSRRLAPSQASARSPPRPLQQLYRTPRCSDPAGSSLPGLGSHLERKVRAAKSGSVESPSRATATSVGCSSSVRQPSCG